MNTGRDNFSTETKRILASRVAYRCCYPGCLAITIGPNTTDEHKIVNLGEAAHIHAAAPGGPRHHPEMSAEERKSIQNGIWMCRKHARLIDANYGNYAAETLSQWKKTAEAETYRQLKEVAEVKFPDPTTIICLSQELLFEGVWKGASNDTWTFLVKEFIYGDSNLIKAYDTRFNKPFKNYIIIESQGDGRLINQDFQWQLIEGQLEISVKVFPPVIRRDPSHIGMDIATRLDGDIQFEAGDFKVVSGKEFAKQLIERNLGLSLGSWPLRPTIGSLFTQYYNEHKNNRLLLNRLVKIELTRLITIPVNPEDPADQPELNFINRIHEVLVMEELDGIVSVYITLEWGDGSFSGDTLHVQLHQPEPKQEEAFEELPDFVKNMLDQEPFEQMKKLTSKLNSEEMREKVNPEVMMKIFKELLPAIMDKANTALETEIFPLFDSHILYRTFDNNTFEYNTSYDLELALYQYGIVQQMGVTISLKGFKKAGIRAFDVVSDLFIFFNDYNYLIGNARAQPWMIKMYHQMPSTEEINHLANHLINHAIKQINQKILHIDSV